MVVVTHKAAFKCVLIGVEEYTTMKADIEKAKLDIEELKAKVPK